MGREVVGPDVGLGLDDPDHPPFGSGSVGLTDQERSDQLAGRLEGGAGEDRSSGRGIDQASRRRIAENVSTTSLGKRKPTPARMFEMT
jgi:hypothetical protein